MTPRFKVGDWVIDKSRYNVGQVESVAERLGAFDAKHHCHVRVSDDGFSSLVAFDEEDLELTDRRTNVLASGRWGQSARKP